MVFPRVAQSVDVDGVSMLTHLLVSPLLMICRRRTSSLEITAGTFGATHAMSGTHANDSCWHVMSCRNGRSSTGMLRAVTTPVLSRATSKTSSTSRRIAAVALPAVASGAKRPAASVRLDVWA